jgi:hypothetical protein
MKKCSECVFFLPHKFNGFNCGFLYKTVCGNDGCCRHFQSVTAPAESQRL